MRWCVNREAETHTAKLEVKSGKKVCVTDQSGYGSQRNAVITPAALPKSNQGDPN